MAVSKRTRFEVFKRDEFRCQYCGQSPPAVILECDHIHPVAEGGEDDIDNLATACFDCNRGKSDRLLSAIPEPMAAKAARMQEAAEQLEAYSALLMSKRQAREDAIDRLGDYWHKAHGDPGYTFSGGRRASVRKFLEMLPEPHVLDAMDVAMGRLPPLSRGSDTQCFKYFCGVCWRTIKGDRQE
jgi:hypothetical protein